MANLEFSREQVEKLRDLDLEERIKKLNLWFPIASKTSLKEKIGQVKEWYPELFPQYLIEDRIKLAKQWFPQSTEKEIEALYVSEKKCDFWVIIGKLNSKLSKETSEAPTEADAAEIEKILDLSHYDTYRDLIINLLNLCFYFDGNQVKETAAKFIDHMLANEIVEPSIIFGMLQGEYISRKTYVLLKKYDKLIKKQGWHSVITGMLNKIFEKGGCEITRCGKNSCERVLIPLTEEKKKMIQNLIEIYSPQSEQGIKRQQILDAAPQGIGLEAVAEMTEME